MSWCVVRDPLTPVSLFALQEPCTLCAQATKSGSWVFADQIDEVYY